MDARSLCLEPGDPRTCTSEPTAVATIVPTGVAAHLFPCRPLSGGMIFTWVGDVQIRGPDPAALVLSVIPDRLHDLTSREKVIVSTGLLSCMRCLRERANLRLELLKTSRENENGVAVEKRGYSVPTPLWARLPGFLENHKKTR